MAKILKIFISIIAVAIIVINSFLISGCTATVTARRGSYDDKGNCTVPKGNECWLSVAKHQLVVINNTLSRFFMPT